MILVRRLLTAAYVALFVTSVHGQFPPKSGYVPDAKTAVRVAEAVLGPVYGERHIKSEEPFKAKLTDGVWHVSGTLHCPKRAGVVCVGGTAFVEISKEDARIISLGHYK